MENWIVCLVNSIAAVDVGTYQVAITCVLAENICLMSRCVGAEQSVFINVVRIGSISTRVMIGKS